MDPRRRLRRSGSQEGQDQVECALLLTLVALASGATLTLLGDQVVATWESLGSRLVELAARI